MAKRETVEEAVTTQPEPHQEPAHLGPDVYRLIAAVSGELAQAGIGKTKKNEQQGYQFRGIDDVYNALAPVMSKHGLVMLPRMIERTVTERVTKSGSTLFYVLVNAEFDFVATSDGSTHTVCTYGEAMDSGDKATNKAMSAAYKYAAFQTFCIPTEAQDADATTHTEIVPDAPKGFAEWWDDLTATADNGVDALRAAWKASPEAMRKHLLVVNNAGWEALKRHAGTVVNG